MSAGAHIRSSGVAQKTNHIIAFCAKRGEKMHVGHLRSTIIGDAAVRTLDSSVTK
ncbi:arginine--tRNA ligase [Escherichia coli]